MLWNQYHSILSEVNIQDILILSAPCINLFCRLKLASLKTRFETFNTNDKKIDIYDTYLNPSYDFVVS